MTRPLRPTDPVGAKEIAARLGVEAQTVQAWQHRGLLPEPCWPEVGGRPAWAWEQIRDWAADTDRAKPSLVIGKWAELAVGGATWTPVLEVVHLTVQDRTEAVLPYFRGLPRIPLTLHADDEDAPTVLGAQVYHMPREDGCDAGWVGVAPASAGWAAGEWLLSERVGTRGSGELPVTDSAAACKAVAAIREAVEAATGTAPRIGELAVWTDAGQVPAARYPGQIHPGRLARAWSGTEPG